MAKNTIQKLAAGILFLVAILLIVAGVYTLSLRGSEHGAEMLSGMRARSLLAATGEGAVESFVSIAKKEAVEKAKAEGAGMSEIRNISVKAEEEARANASASLVDYSAVDLKPFEAALTTLHTAMVDFTAEEARAQAAFIERQAESAPADSPIATATPLPAAAESAVAPSLDSGMSEDSMLSMDGDDLSLALDEEPAVDLSGFQQTPEMLRLKGIVDERFEGLAKALQGVFPVLDDASLVQLKSLLLPLVHQSGDNYQTEYDRYSKSGGLDGLRGSDAWLAPAIRNGNVYVAIGIALVLLSLIVLFYGVIVQRLGVPLVIIVSFFMLLCVLSVMMELSIAQLLSNSLVRLGMNSIMVLAMVPAIQCGISLNLGLPIGIVGGLLGGLLCIELGFSGWWGFAFATIVGVIISTGFGYLYGLLLNRLKGSEMAVTTYVGFSFVSLMSIAWLVLPFQSLVLKWPLGNGLRTTISMGPAFPRLLDQFLAFRIGSVVIPTGLLLFMFICCFLMWLFMRSKTGIAMRAVGANPRFAEATGINVDKMRIVGTILSTALGAVGIIVYAQSYGFMQLYTAPRSLGLIAASAILIGGATTSRAKISHVLIGTYLFQGVLSLGMPVANALMPGSTVAETMRILVSNGIILYALTKSGGGSRA